jgi:hypothetical protein
MRDLVAVGGVGGVGDGVPPSRAAEAVARVAGLGAERRNPPALWQNGSMMSEREGKCPGSCCEKVCRRQRAAGIIERNTCSFP